MLKSSSAGGAASATGCFARSTQFVPRALAVAVELPQRVSAILRDYGLPADALEVNGAEVSVIKGDDLLKQNFPMIHAVGLEPIDYNKMAGRHASLIWSPPSLLEKR